MVENRSDCSTKYPLLLIHGAGFRDKVLMFDYWGRIPKHLTAQGATVFYGGQDAWSSIRGSALEIGRTIDALIKKYDISKFNVIAHSKGGLDCRYLVSSLGYGNKIASFESSQWTNFTEITAHAPRHGFSHADVVDYRRRNRFGTSLPFVYQSIVASLKERGL
jgi:hypothetical protein